MGNQLTFDKDFSPMPIADLIDGHHLFVIPSFQRGYRWEKKQVLDLLEDIKQFAEEDAPTSDSYFLQPIVVKRTHYNGQEAFEVLDGQQRLTTMLLILKRLMRKLGEDDRTFYEDNLYKIVYKNRPQLNFDHPSPADNIDSFYLYEAKTIIDNWFKEQTEKRQNLSRFIGTLLYAQKQQVKIIWYALDKDRQEIESINIFNRLNRGKISLTSSELIKALFIMDYELSNNGDNTASEQLSMEWNEMERKFQDDKFWYFISDDDGETQTRIDVIFDFVTQRKPEQDKDYSYREFQRLYDFCRKKDPADNESTFDCTWCFDIRDMRDAWKYIRRTFDRLEAWYEDNMYYHYIGYLVAVGFTPLNTYNWLEEAKLRRKRVEPNHEWTDEDTENEFHRLIMERFKDPQKNTYITKDAIDDFEYSNQDMVRRILLLFNVETCLKSKNIRFAFDQFKKGQWDIEHVDSQNEASLQEFGDRLRWLKNVKFILGLEHTNRASDLAKVAGNLITDFEENEHVNLTAYNDFYTKVNKHYAAENGEDEEKVDLTTRRKDYLSNLTLLDSRTNREYKDAPFAYKRYCIVKYDRLGDRFIPVCTRNLFLKYYSDSDKQSSFLDTIRWNEADRSDYLKAIHEKVDPIFDSVVNKEDTDEQ
ncbi:MAG: DUF262 domain-containing protein [Prevotella sp.]|jgi:hypothetical protein